MTGADFEGPATAADDRYQALLAVSAAIIAHRDLSALFQQMAGRLRQIVHCDHLSLVLHEAATNTLRVHLLEPPESFTIDVPLEERPAGLVWQTQQPLITSRIDDFKRWPRLMAHVQSYGVESSCWLHARAFTSLATLVPLEHVGDLIPQCIAILPFGCGQLV